MNAGLIVTLILGVVAPTSAAWATVRVAQIRASRSSPAEMKTASAESDRVSLDTFREFRTWAESRMDWQDQRIAVLEGALAKVSEKYTLIKEAFREFYREVRALLGTGTPVLDEHVRELLTEQDLDDTFGHAALKKLREDAPPPPPPPV